MSTSRPPQPGSWPLIGRDTEMARAAAAVSDGPGAVVFTGPSGVGKTRLAREFVDRLILAGHRVEQVVGTRAAAGIPFGAFVRFLDPRLPERDPTGSLWQVIARISGRMDEAAEPAPLERRRVLFVDDAHLLDSASAAAVHHLAMSREAAVVMTVSSGQPCHDAVSRVWRDGYATLVQVGQLDRIAIGRLLEAGLGAPIDGYTLGRLQHLTGGNVLALYEMVTAAREAGALRFENGTWRWSGQVSWSGNLADLTADLLASSSPAERDALLLVALAGPIATDVVAGLTDPAVVEAMCDKGLLRAAAHGGTVSLPQPLYGERLLTQAPPVTVRRLRRQLAAALTDSTSVRLRVKLLVDAGERPTDEELLEAADEAAAGLDGELAERLATLAAPQTLRRAVVLARALSLLGRFEEVAAILAHAEPDQPTLEVAIARLVNYVRGLRRPDLAMAYLAELTERSDSVHLTRALRVYAAVLTRRYTDAALACADDPMLEQFELEVPAGWAVLQLAGAYYQLGRAEESVALLLRHIVNKPPETVLALRFAVVGALLACGRPEEAAEQADGLLEWGTRIAWPAAACLGMGARGGVFIYRGRYEAAAETLREAAAMARDHAPGASRHFILCQLATAEAALGRHDVARSALAEAATFREGNETPYLKEQEHRTDAFLRACAGETSSAANLLRELVGPTIEESAWVQTLEVMTLLARLGHAREAAGVVNDMPVFTPYARACVEHINALAAGSGDRLLKAATAYEEVGAVGLAAEVADVAAERYGERGPYAAHAAALRTRDRLLADNGVGRLPWWPSRQRVALSPREREVATLAAAGRSSPEIASSLFLSVRTVENHLQRAYTKLGVSNRTSLRAALQAQA